MARNLQDIYKYLSNYSEEEIDDILYDLSVQEKNLIKKRYGFDLNNPIKNDNFTTKDSRQFYNCLIPKIRRKLNNNKNINYSELKKEVLELLGSKNDCNRICSILGINTKTLYNILLRLKNEGLMISRKYYSDGSIKYKKVNSFSSLKDMTVFSQTKTIITEPKEYDVKFLVISDLHFGNRLERLDLIDRAYNYCIKNNINLILNGGDLIDGTYTKGEQNLTDTYEQIKYLIKSYPHDKNILTFGVAGDHDHSAFLDDSINIVEILDNFRHDIILVGYNNAIINIKNEKIQMYHSFKNTTIQKSDASIILHGHLHEYKASYIDDTLNITIPALSCVNQELPTALELDINFYKGYINNTIIKQIHFGKQDFILNELTFNLIKDKTIMGSAINNVEAYKKKVKTI